MHIMSILVSLSVFFVQLLALVHSALGDGDAEIRYAVAELVDELAFLGHVLVFVVEEVADVGPLEVGPFGFLN